MKTLLIAFLTAAMTLTVCAIEPGSYVVSFANQSERQKAYPGLLLTITSSPAGLQVEVIQEGRESKATAVTRSRSPGQQSYETIELSIVLGPSVSSKNTRMFLLSGQSERKKFGEKLFSNFSGGAMASTAGDWAHLHFTMHKISAGKVSEGPTTDDSVEDADAKLE